jgi:Tfp pilus assembly protein PilX
MKPHFRRNHCGFALIITVVLVAFLVLILVGLATFTRVETQVASNAQDSAKARQNALMALNIAVGQLQRTAGPDQRVTALAEIQDTTPATPAISGVLNPKWTGIWDSTAATATPLAWLVSGSETSSPSNALTNDVTAATAGVQLVGANSAGTVATAISGLVHAPLVDIESSSVPGLPGNQRIGRYAYWVGDEGVKSSASLVDALAAANVISYDNSLGADPVDDDWSADAVKKERLNQIQLPRPRLEKILATVDPDLASNVIAQPKVLERNQLLFLNASPSIAQVRNSFHDTTPLSRGVLADTAIGTLRTDLTSNTGTAGAVTSFLTLRPANIPVTLPAGVEAEFFPVSPSSVAGTWPTYGLYPVLAEAGIRIGFSIVGGQVALNYFLETELWNPYAARLRMDAARTLRFSVTFPAAVNFLLRNTTDSTTQAVSIAAGTKYAADIVNTNILEPGQITRFRGGATMDLVSVGVAQASVTIPGAATVTDPIGEVDAQSTVSNLVFSLELVNSGVPSTPPLQNLTLGSVFDPEPGIANATPTPALGYGYEFNRDLRVWSEGTQGQSRDPRLPVMSGVAFQETAAAAWSVTNPSANGVNGFSGVALNDGARVILFDLPRQEVTAVAQLRHMIGARSYELGNSWGAGVNNTFDTSFISTTPRNFSWPVDNSLQRPNRYLDVYTPEGVPPATLTDLRDPASAARYQLIRGAFNINSTSQKAWESVLGAKLAGWDHSGAGAGVALDNAFFRTEHGAQQRGALSGTVTVPVPTTGALATLSALEIPGATGRQLTAVEVTNLATEIVRLLKVRGRPFTSLAEFANSGLIQTAIDSARTQGSILVGLNSDISNAELRFTAAALTQADVIACIAPFMAARSDTFVVRAYGEVVNPATGDRSGRAWCEATVQRLPDLVSNSAAPVATVINPPPASNPFGRRFKITSLRWLSPDDL